MNVSDMQVSDEDGHLIVLLGNITIKANSKIVKERIWINPLSSARYRFSLWIPTLTRPVARGACAFSAKGRKRTLSSISETSQVECGHPETSC